jgi:hypothetical protein
MLRTSWKKYRSKRSKKQERLILELIVPQNMSTWELIAQLMKLINILFKEYLDVFEWSYDYLKAYDKTIFQHSIPVRDGANLVKQMLRMMNPKLKPLEKVELEKLKKVGIIHPIRHFDSLSNHVVVRKNTREIQMCVDFRDLDKKV